MTKKRIISMLLVFILSACLIVPAFADDDDSLDIESSLVCLYDSENGILYIGTGFSDEPYESYSVLCIKHLDAVGCKDLYNMLKQYKGAYDQFVDVYDALKDSLSMTTGINDPVANLLCSVLDIAFNLKGNYFDSLIDALYCGWQSRRGCTIIVYDNEIPNIFLN